MLPVMAMNGVATAMVGLASLAIAGLFFVAEPGAASPGFTRVEMRGGASLLVQEREVTRREWQACVEAKACEAIGPAPPPSDPDMPMTGVNHLDAESYIAWLNQHSSRVYRLPTAAEWNAIAFDLPHKPYKKLFTDPRLAWAADYGAMEKVSAVLQPSGSFGALKNGIFDLGGNVWEWTSTCSMEGASPDRCPAYRVEGLHETVISVFVRNPSSGGCAVGAPPANVGFRLVSDP
jgi:formylglycine-generating enzyme required for sulfatase activity